VSVFIINFFFHQKHTQEDGNSGSEYHSKNRCIDRKESRRSTVRPAVSLQFETLRVRRVGFGNIDRAGFLLFINVLRKLRMWINCWLTIGRNRIAVFPLMHCYIDSARHVCYLPSEIWCTKGPDACAMPKRKPGSEAGVNYKDGWSLPQGCSSTCEVCLYVNLDFNIEILHTVVN